MLVIGVPADAPLAISPFEYWFAAEPAYRAGDYDRAVAMVSEGLVDLDSIRDDPAFPPPA